MSGSKVSFVDVLPEEVEKEMSAGMADYESDHGVDVNFRRFSIIIEDDLGKALGVLNAYTAYAEIYIDDLWVDSRYRGKGYGTKLIQSLEDTYRDQGFNNINLVTSAFQAPGFYRKCGFKEEFTRANLQNPELSKTFFVKFFDNKIQTQGLEKSAS